MGSDNYLDAKRQVEREMALARIKEAENKATEVMNATGLKWHWDKYKIEVVVPLDQFYDK